MIAWADDEPANKKAACGVSSHLPSCWSDFFSRAGFEHSAKSADSETHQNAFTPHQIHGIDVRKRSCIDFIYPDQACSSPFPSPSGNAPPPPNSITIGISSSVCVAASCVAGSPSLSFPSPSKGKALSIVAGPSQTCGPRKNEPQSPQVRRTSTLGGTQVVAAGAEEPSVAVRFVSPWSGDSGPGRPPRNDISSSSPP